MRKSLLLWAWLVPSVALAQAEELENPGTVAAVQERIFRMSHELTLGIGVLPLDAFFKGLMAQVGYTYHFSDSFGWQIGRAAYSYNFDTGLTQQLKRDFGVQPTQFEEAQWFVGSDLVWSPIYGKTAWLNHTVSRFEGFGILGGSIFNLVYGPVGGGSTFRPAINVGIGFRLFSGQHVSYRLDLTDNVLINLGTAAAATTVISNVATLQLSLGLNFGGAE